ncbi:SgcJ/EcaC family oxidoreductase [Streptomyces kaniharaensis]|uniref:SgcJ/EcaC family oxidoreductase n=1 Tax=Streptomyces kaniharaensis TaxID=212423 RepID=UPI002DDD0119|nr:SgcJ/EcaC family oxidoreductase [Streptomyces kaniharaensis]
MTGQPLAAKFHGPDFALVVTQGGVLAPGETEVAGERAIRATWMLARQDGGWLIAGYQNTPIHAG